MGRETRRNQARRRLGRKRRKTARASLHASPADAAALAERALPGVRTGLGMHTSSGGGTSHFRLHMQERRETMRRCIAARERTGFVDADSSSPGRAVG